MAIFAYPYSVRDSTNTTTDNRKTGLTPSIGNGKTLAASPTSVTAAGNVSCEEIGFGDYVILYDAEANGDASFPIDWGSGLSNPNDRFGTAILTQESDRILTSLPDVAPGNPGSLICVGASAGQINPSVGNVNLTTANRNAIVTALLVDPLASTDFEASNSLGAFLLALSNWITSAVAPASTALSTTNWTGAMATELASLMGGSSGVTFAGMTGTMTEIFSLTEGISTATYGGTPQTGDVFGLVNPMISSHVFTTGALVHAPTGGGSAQTGDVFGLLNPLIASDAFTVDALVNAPGGSGSDPWSVQLPGSYEPGSAGFVLGGGADHDGLCQAGSMSTTIILDESTGPDVLGRSIVILEGSAADQSRVLATYDPETKVAGIDRPWVVTPTAGSPYALGLTALGYSLSTAGLDAIQVESGVNARQALSPILAAAAGAITGNGTGTVLVKSPSGGATRVTGTMVGADRTATTLNLPT